MLEALKQYISDDRRILFILAFAINLLSFTITIHLLNIGAIEGNPIMNTLFSHGIPFALLLTLSLWTLLYFILIYLPEKSRDSVWITASKYACSVLLVMISIDFLNDYIWLIISL